MQLSLYLEGCVGGGTARSASSLAFSSRGHWAGMTGQQCREGLMTFKEPTAECVLLDHSPREQTDTAQHRQATLRKD